MGILRFEEITLASRLKGLLAERKDKNGFPMKVSALYLHYTDSKTGTERQIHKNTMSKWLSEKNPVILDRIDKDALQRVADFLDVDIDYLLCKQVEQRKKPVDASKFDSMIDKDEYARQLHLLIVGKPLLKALGYEVTEETKSVASDTDFIIIAEDYKEKVKERAIVRTRYYLVEYEYSSPIKTEFEITKAGATILNLSEAEYFDLIDDMESYSLSRLKRLAERKQ